MSFGDLVPDERQAAIEAEMLRPITVPPPEPPGFWDNITGGAGEVGRTFARAGTGLALAASTPLIAFDKVTGSHTADPVFDFVRDRTEHAVDYWKPDYQTVGMAGQVVGGLLRMGTEATMGGVLGVVGNEQFNQSFDVADAGGSTTATVASGVARGLTMAAMLRLPAAMGAGRVQSAALGAGANVGLGVIDRAVQQAILQADDLDKLAEQYKPFDPTSLLVDGIFGGVAGGLLGRSRPEIATGLNAEHRAAAQTLQLVDAQAEGRLLPTEPFDAEIAARMNDVAFARVRADGPIAVDPATPIDPGRLSMARARVAQALADEIDATPPELIARDRVEGPSPTREEVHAAELRTSILTGALEQATRMRPATKTGPVDARIDNVRTALEKLGGINRAAAVAEGIDPADAAKMARLFPHNGKLASTDDVLEALKEEGYLPEEAVANDALNLLTEVVGGRADNARSLRQDAEAIGPDILRSYGHPAEAEAALRAALSGKKLGAKQSMLVQQLMDEHAVEVRDFEARIDEDPMRAWDDMTREEQGQIVADWDSFLKEYEHGLTDQAPAADAGVAAQGDRPANAAAEASAGSEVGRPDIGEIPKPVEAPDGEPSPAMLRADDIAATNPDLRVPAGVDADGQTLYATAAELMASVRDELATAKRESTAFEAAANCMLGG